MKRHERRVRRLPLKLEHDRLETRWLMSSGLKMPRTVDNRELIRNSIEALFTPRPDLDAFASQLAHQPKFASSLDLGALGHDLRRHADLASRFGWGAVLADQIVAHPKYAAQHDLTHWLDVSASGMTSPVSPPADPTSQTISTVVTVSPTNPAPSQPVTPPVISPITEPPISMPESVATGGTLDVTLPNMGLGNTDLAYTITPQPLPANMSFNRETGELIFSPAPGQQGLSSYSVLVSSAVGSGTITVPITVTDPAVASTEVSGQIVDENGDPLADMPVTIDGSSAVTNASGQFTLTGISSNPGPLSAGGSVGSDQGRLDLAAPVEQLLGHSIYQDANNVISSPLILPEINWSNTASFSQTSTTSALDITNTAMPGFDIQIPAGNTESAPISGTLSVATLPASVSAQHMPAGVGGGFDPL
jgi:hypothetical protein